MILVALGSNLPGPWGSPRQTIERATKELDRASIKVLLMSDLIETLPYGNINQPCFVNAVAQVQSHKTPEALMRSLHMLERQAGRKRGKRWGARTLDLDLIDYHGLVRSRISTDIKPLVLPHPGALLRSFVLGPIAEIAPRWRHPISRQTAREAISLLDH
jgi:2-amino-4-hydroxy-6-hydroxymethyldihydropteridine diphosphokinase